MNNGPKTDPQGAPQASSYIQALSPSSHLETDRQVSQVRFEPGQSCKPLKHLRLPGRI